MDDLPSELTTRIKDIYTSTEQDILDQAFQIKSRRTTFRINTLLSNSLEIETRLTEKSIVFEKLSFFSDAYILEATDEKVLWNLDIYKQGKIYIQGISSQIPVELFSEDTSRLRQNKQLRILDACAAPGGKTNQLAARFPSAEIYAFEPHKIRYEKMLHNLKKTASTNVKKYHDSVLSLPKHAGATEEYFDMILVDAPCSSEGSISVFDRGFLENWDISHINKNYRRQKQILDAVVPYLKLGGELIYSTCTLAPEENEAVIHYLLCKYKNLELQKIDIPENKYINKKASLKSFGKHIYKTEISEKSLRLVPNIYTEGFYIAKIIKRGVDTDTIADLV